MSFLRNGEKVYQDDNGKEYVLDEMGNRRPPMHASYKMSVNEDSWKEYDTSQGHCVLCGRLDCNGYCFK